MNQEACCTCAQLLNASSNASFTAFDGDEKSAFARETKQFDPSPEQRTLLCCGRKTCGACMTKNPRFASYCPYCQVSDEPSSLPQGLRDPPAYSSAPPSPKRQNTKYTEQMAALEDPPAYTPEESASRPSLGTEGGSSSAERAPDITHYLTPTDNVASLSLAYKVPASVLRQHNSLYSDHLLSARRTISIPGSHYRGQSLSPHPVDDPEESEHKSKIRRFMLGAKCHKYEVAELYLKQADGSVDSALENWRDDERWEKENPFERRPKTKLRMKTTSGGGSLAGQLL